MTNKPPYHTIARLVILAPNWLGDAVMALPAIADVRRARPDCRVTIAARPSIAPLFRLLAESGGPSDDVEVVTLERRRWSELGAEVDVLRAGRFDAALLLPNSLRSALMVSRAGIAERWGYRSDCRGRLLTRAVQPPRVLHQVELYQRLVQALGFPNGPIEPTLAVPAAARDAAEQLLAGVDRARPRVAIAPGAAYGGAKRWPPAFFAALARSLAGDGIETIMVGSAADRRTADEVLQSNPHVHDLVGKTDLAALTGILASCRTLVTNDSGAMHLAAAVGTPVTAVFGPTDERATRPLGDRHAILTGPAWCRPCMLRECPLDHRCMRGIEVAPVVAAARRTL